MVDGVGSVEQPIDGRAPFRSFRRRNDPAVGQDHGLAPRPPSRGVRRQKVRPRNADVSGRRSGRRLKPALASTPRNAKRGDKRAHSSNPGKAQFGLRTQFGPLISGTISGACGDNMTQKPRNKRPVKPAKGRGYVQVMARRALMLMGEASTPQILEWTRVRKLMRGIGGVRDRRRWPMTGRPRPRADVEPRTDEVKT